MASTAGNDITVPGGVKVFFTETGGSERDLGNIVGDSPSISRDTEELDHFTNRSGKRRKNKVITVEEAVQLDFELDEINAENLRYFFKGGSISDVGAGTTAVVDQDETLTAEIYNSVDQPGLTSVSVRQFLKYVYFDALGTGVTYLDHSIEADTVAGSDFTINADAAGLFYIGKDTQFSNIDVDITIGSVGYTSPLWEYWDGTAWVTATVGAVTSNDFAQDDTLTLTVPGDWAKTTVNTVSAYYLRFSQAAASPTAATIASIGRNSLTALVDHTDFDVDPGDAVTLGSVRNGAVRRIAAGVLESGEAVKVSYTYATFTSQTFGIAETSTLEGSARFESFPGTGRGRKWSMIIPKAQLVNNGNMDLDDTDFETIPLSLVVLDNFDCDPVNPFGTVTVFPHA